ncbi:DUF1934 domain-containing protein [Lactococcus nasutitermitis]|uniref:DUF1934 domain-containing protein n=1 Tax=Lactococcus nasutitermitis TaxID=1652957 RepID=A0ABV9JCH7_9LACT|nr:DUF1934 domain-containing protein [Lactococcus nasutitermitis]
MIKINIHSHIKIERQEEAIHEEYKGELKEIAGKICLIYTNSQDEKVLIKFDEQELSMTRYTDNPISMHFHKEFPTKADYAGLGKLSILTKDLSVNSAQQIVELYYHLAQNELKIGEYRMQITWEEIG